MANMAAAKHDADLLYAGMCYLNAFAVMTAQDRSWYSNSARCVACGFLNIPTTATPIPAT